MQYSVTVESEITRNGTKIQYDIFLNQPKKAANFSPPHIHSYYELLLVHKGNMICNIDGKENLVLQEGDIIFIPPNIIHETSRFPDCELTCVVVKFSPLYLYPMETTASDLYCLLVSPHFSEKHYLFNKGSDSANDIGKVMMNCLHEQQEKKVGYELALRGQLMSLYVTIIRNCMIDSPQHSSDDPMVIDSNSAQQLHNILVYMKENCQYDISMQEIADVCGMNYYNFSRFFKKMTNMKFNDYLTEMRLNNAQKKLLKEDKTVIEVAMECGFNNISYFIHKFKEKTGLTPNSFRRKYRYFIENDAEKASDNPIKQ